MDPTTAAHDAYFHVRVVIGMVTGLGLTRLLSGIARFVLLPGRRKVYPVHVGWTLYMLLAVMHFWWFEFALSGVAVWTFGLYLFLVSFASVYFLIAAVLYPETLDGFDGYEDYLRSCRGWFYGLLALLVACDTVDTALKGAAYFDGLGNAYLLRQAFMAGMALAAIRISDRRFHEVFVTAALAIECAWIFWRYQVLG